MGSVLVLTLISAVLHAMWNAGLRRERDKDSAVVIAIAVASTLAAVVAAIRWAAGVPPFATGDALVWTLLAAVLEGGYFAALARALDTGALGPVYTISRGGTLLLVWPVSIWLWGEQLTGLHLLGSVVVFVGLAVSSGARGATREAVGWSSLCAVLIAGYHLAYKAALRDGGDGPAVFAISLGVATAVNLVRLRAAGRAKAAAELRRRGWPLAVIGALCSAAFLIFLVALARGGAGLVLTLRNTSVIFATLASALLGEQPGRRQVLGASVVVVGAALLGWP
ncbi:MAG: DMT family transporter [Kofleriaceae bacterium]